MNSDDFLYRDLPVVGKRAHRLGLAFSNGIEPAGIETAFDRGVNYLFWTNFSKGAQMEVVRAALQRDREGYVLCGGATLGFMAGSLRRAATKLLRKLDLDYIDVFQLYWLGKMSAFTNAVQQELLKLRDEGLVRAVGVSIHDRKRAARLAEDSPLDMLMLRYNAAHPGAETDIFPSYEKRRPLTVAYTATSWRKLLKRPKGWDGPVMTAGDCYRFCLSSPHVDVVLSAAGSRGEIEENLESLSKGPLTPEEDDWMRRFGRVVHGKGGSDSSV
jgi:aryl-alcohol dehydrogenase-like predicted oxidoreductase